MSAPPNIPPQWDAIWKELAKGNITRPWSMLAMRIMMSRITRETAADPSPATVQRCASEIYAFFQKNASLAAADIALIAH